MGYRAQMQGSNLVLALGFSHPVEVDAAGGHFLRRRGATCDGIEASTSETVGQVAANIRKLRPPEPYLGKGVRYQGEFVRRKAGKSGKGR